MFKLQYRQGPGLTIICFDIVTTIVIMMVNGGGRNAYNVGVSNLWCLG